MIIYVFKLKKFVIFIQLHFNLLHFIHLLFIKLFVKHLQ